MKEIDVRGERDTPLVELVRTAFLSARAALEGHTATVSCNLRDLACTLILAVAREDGLAIGHIGDGAVVGDTATGLSIISKPEESEFTNEVFPITNSNWEDHTRIVSSTSLVKSIAMFTDGCQRAAFRKAGDTLEPFDKFFNPIFSYAHGLKDVDEGTREIVDLLQSGKVCDNSDDDKTLVVAVFKTG
jgi:hypothetical protein